MLVFTGKTVENTSFCDLTPYSAVEVNERLGGTYYLHLQGQRVSQTSKQLEARKEQSNACRLASCLLLHWLIILS
jgi:hypothetical protein